MREVLQSELLQPIKDRFVIDYLSAAGSQDFSRVKANIMSLSQDESINKESIGEALRRLAWTNVAPAFETLANLTWSQSYAGAYVGISSTWVMDDPETASREIAMLKGRPAYDWAVAGLAQATRVVDPEVTKKWMLEIKDPAALDMAKSITYTFRQKY
jgi:hypothetical protein